MDNLKAAQIIRRRWLDIDNYLAAAKRRRHMRPSEKSMLVASYIEEKEAMKLAYIALTGDNPQIDPT